jgi:hypothetical protein
MKKQLKLPKMTVKKLVKKFGGANVVRRRDAGQKVFKSLEGKALDRFDPTRETFLVAHDCPLEGSSERRYFGSKGTALRYTRALPNGNVDQRVPRIRGQVLVVATANDL